MKEVYLKNDNYIQISGWMLNELQLKGIELLLYALIHGFSQDGKSDYHGGLQYMALWTNSSKQGVIKALKSLIEKGLIDKSVTEQNGIQFVKYWTTKSRNSTKNTSTQSTEFTTKQNKGSQLSLPTQSTEFTGGSQLSLPNNTNINSLNSISVPETKEAERKKELTDAIKTLFDNSLAMFSDDLIPKLYELTQNLETRLLRPYVKYVYSLVQQQKPKKTQGMFYKFVLQNNTLDAFVESLAGRTGKNQQNWICPVCSKENRFYEDCEKCGTEFNLRNDLEHIKIKKQIFLLPEEKKNNFNKELFSISTKVNFAEYSKEKTRIYEKYGIGV